jgi:alanine-glyoxylate transaminase/serine-glyoxylate transaminase/serine-pyruvate transaminase
MIFEEGLDNVFTRHRLLAQATRAAVNVWTEGQMIKFNITEPAERSDTVTTILVNDAEKLAQLRAYCNKKCGVILGAGIGELIGKGFRIAHMGHVNAPMMLGTLGAVDMAMTALDIPHGGCGTAAAIKLLGEKVTA